MLAHRVDQLNIGLILVSLIAAFLLPFHLFLFAYAVLGPLHYLTEIAWLKKQRFFLSQKFDFIILALFAILFFVSDQFLHSNEWKTAVIYLAFLSALIMISVQNIKTRCIVFIIAILSAFFLKEISWYTILFGAFLATVIHVYVFTATFMLYGALKSKSFWGIVSVLFLVLSGIICLLPFSGNTISPLSDIVRSSYQTFQGVNREVMNLLNFQGDIYSSSTGISVMRFIAFAYTYHYLNWFSKTSLIGWYDASKKYLTTIGALWIASIGIYLYDYQLGFVCLLFLSILHVFLEFPLNFHSFKGIGIELKKMIT